MNGLLDHASLVALIVDLEGKAKQSAKRKSKSENDNDRNLRLRHDENLTTIIGPALPEDAPEEKNSHYERMVTLTEGFFRLRRDKGLAGGGSNAGCFWGQLKKDVIDLVDFMCGGIIGYEIELRGIERIIAEPHEILKQQVLHPMSFSDSACDLLSKTIKMPNTKGKLSVVCSSSTISNRRQELVKYLRPLYNVTIEKRGWRYNGLKPMLVKLLKYFKAHDVIGADGEPLDLKLWFDGAPTLTLVTRVALMLHIIDGRLSQQIFENPQDRDNHHVLAEYFGKEDPSNMCYNFERLINDARELNDTGISYEVDGRLVHVRVRIIVCPDMKARWSAVKAKADADEPAPAEPTYDSDDELAHESQTFALAPPGKGVGGGISQATWPDDLGPLHESRRDWGAPGGCLCCRTARDKPCLPGRLVPDEQDPFFFVKAPSASDGFSECRCPHMDPFDESGTRSLYIAERDARLSRVREESVGGDVDPLDRVRPLLADKPARVREVLKRYPSMSAASLSSKKADVLGTMLQNYCTAMLATSERLPARVVSELNDRAVLVQLALHGMSHDARDMAACRAKLEQRLIDVLILRQIIFCLEWPGVPRSALVSGLLLVGDVLHLEVINKIDGAAKPRPRDRIASPSVVVQTLRRQR